MSEASPSSSYKPIQSLNVLPHSGKVEQLRHESQQSSESHPSEQKNLNNQTLVERACDPSKTPQQKALEEKVIERIKTVYDPEIPVNIYELGLIYSIDITPENEVTVKMTLTAPACPVAGELPPQVEKTIEMIPEVKSARVDLVWDPPWSKDMMSEAAKLELGLF
jgi:FeS assembly SUF system protein